MGRRVKNLHAPRTSNFIPWRRVFMKIAYWQTIVCKSCGEVTHRDYERCPVCRDFLREQEKKEERRIVRNYLAKTVSFFFKFKAA